MLASGSTGTCELSTTGKPVQDGSLNGKQGGGLGNMEGSMFVTSVLPQTGETAVKKDRLERAKDMLTSLDPSAGWEMALTFLKIADSHPQGIAQVELVAALSHPRSNVSRWVDRLGEKSFTRVGKTRYANLGLVRRVTSSYDQRINVLTLTPLGVRKKVEVDCGQ